MASETAREAFRRQLAAMGAEFVRQLGDRLRELEELLHRLEREAWADDALHTFHRRVHSLTGAAATFGIAEVSEAARGLEGILREAVEGTRKRGAGTLAELASHLRRVGEAAAGVRVEPARAPEPERAAAEADLVLLLDGDAETTKELTAQLAYFSYRVERVAGVDEIVAAARRERVVAVLADLDAVVDGDAPRPGWPDALHGVPLVCLASHGDMTARLAAARAGAAGFLTRPVDLVSLVSRLDAIVHRADGEAFRVLVVEDDASLAAHYAGVLASAGIVVQVAPDPLAVLPALADFRPELILMDLYMPTCSGLELAAVIRQLDDYLAVPIVYLSVEQDIRRQMAAIQRGGDDFLTKPIDPAHLVEAVSARLRRFRRLRAMMSRDSLTGLYSHTHIKESLRAEVLRARRHGLPVAFAMIDLDRFKKVNDAHGHLAGDEVLRSVARLLRQRLRKTDLIGRYGGEEFAIVLPEADAAAATRVLDGIREAFAGLVHRFGGAPVALTLSAGVATYPQFADDVALVAAADRALYEAKRAGRDRVVAARPPAADTTVLVVDGEPGVTRLLESILAPTGVRVLVAHNGLAALELVVRERPAYVISDVVLPGLDGFELCRRIKGDAALAGIPVALMTVAKSGEKLREGASAFGADVFLDKPLAEDAVLAAASRLAALAARPHQPD
ncbi:MAG: response regulator [Acidobacteria bacterium]|nr:response regulator [Acidobacteriota bacterium]